MIRVDSIPRPDGFDFGFDSDSIRLRDSTRLAQSRLVRWVGADRSTLSVSMQPPSTPDRSAHRCCWREAGWRMGPIRNYTIFVFKLNLIIRTAPAWQWPAPSWGGSMDGQRRVCASSLALCRRSRHHVAAGLRAAECALPAFMGRWLRCPPEPRPASSAQGRPSKRQASVLVWAATCSFDRRLGRVCRCTSRRMSMCASRQKSSAA